MYITAVVINIILIAIDQLTKRWAGATLQGNTIVIIENVFELYYHENEGMAFGLLQGYRYVFIVITVIILAVIIYCYIKLPKTKLYNWVRVSLILIFAGAVGNLIDRILNKHVVDFLYFKLINFPIFNMADVFVVSGAILFGIILLFFMKDEDIKFRDTVKNDITDKE